MRQYNEEPAKTRISPLNDISEQQREAEELYKLSPEYKFQELRFAWKEFIRSIFYLLHDIFHWRNERKYKEALRDIKKRNDIIIRQQNTIVELSKFKNSRID